MIDGLKPYPATKDSGVTWLGGVPEHWKIMPALAVYRPRQIKNIGLIEKTVLSLSYGRIVVKPPEKLRGLVPESFETYQIVDPGNIIVRTTDLQNDQTSLRIGQAKDRGIITSAYKCLEAKSLISSEFAYQFLNAYDLLKIIYGYGSGLRQNLDFSDIKRMPVLVPPLPEQAAIVCFLDHADRKIRRYIRAKQKLIKLLEEQKQAIIHRAVTRGLNPNVPLKDSGISWLGEIPGHWEVVPVGAISILLQTGPFGSQLHQSDYISGGIPVINPSHMVDGRIAHDPEIGISAEMAAVLSRHAIKPDDILIARRGDLGRCALVSSREDGWVCGTGSMLLRCRKNMILPKFFRIIFSSSGIAEELQLSSIGATMANLNEGVVARQRIPLPTLEDQAMITDWIASKARTIEVSMSSIANEIILLREYRTSLIADVVTGKLDVREAAAGLPEEAMDDELIEDEGLEDLEAGEEDLDLIDDADG